MPQETSSALRETAYLPQPPDATQKWSYFGHGHRWLLWVGFLFTCVAIYSQIKFSIAQTSTIPYLAVVSLVLAVGMVSLYTSTRKRRVTKFDHQALVSQWHANRPHSAYPSIDVFLPSAGEPLDVLANTYHHVAQLVWPGRINVLVLDDSAREQVADLARGYGFHYHSRPNRGEMKKAGNLKYGFEHSGGDFIAVFDADFVPRPDFLYETVPYMQDPTVGIVQTPQFFEAVPHMNWLQRGAGVTQEYFYRFVQPSRDAAGAPICVGTCAVYRRAGLEKSGGFAQIGHSEDVHTGVNLLKAGFDTRYVPVNVSKGICPDTLESFATQQYRWATGSMSLLKDRSFHATKLGWKRKLCFFSGFGYYLITALLVLVGSFPSIAMMWLFTEHYHPRNYVWILPALLWTWIVIPAALVGKWGPEMLRVQVIYGFAHAVAIWDTLRDKTMAWVPTGAANQGTPIATRVKRLMFVWILMLQALMWSGFAYATIHNGTWLSSIPVLLLLVLSAVITWPILWRIKPAHHKRTVQQATRRRITGTLAVAGACGVAFIAVIGVPVSAPLAAMLNQTGGVANSVSAPIAATVTPDTPPTSAPGDTTVAATTKKDEKKRESARGKQRASSTKSEKGAAPSPVEACTPFTAVTGYDFVNSRYEGDQYRIGYGRHLTYCIHEDGRIAVTSDTITPHLLDSTRISLETDPAVTTVEKCGFLCTRLTSTVAGRAIEAGVVKATATATITATIAGTGVTSENRIEYAESGE